MSEELSVCIVAYHNYNDIKRAIETMENYTPAKLTKKVYIVDNGNTSEWEKENKEFLKVIEQYPDVEYVDVHKNLGFGKGNNAVLPFLKSKYHCIMNGR